MREPIVLVVAQPICSPLDLDRNIEAHAALVEQARARVIVFPELSLTGYELAAPAIAPDDVRLTPLIDACLLVNAVALVGAPVHESDGRHIAMLRIDGDGAAVVYRKIWLGGDESRFFEPGRVPAVIDVDGRRLGLAICRDTGIEQHATDTAAPGIDAYVAGTVKTPGESATQHERGSRIAAALGVWVAIASAAGPSGGGYDPAAGHSAIWSPGGSLHAEAGDQPGTCVEATLA